MAFFTIVSVIICIVGSTTGYPFAVNSVMLSPVGIIISFAVSLRTTSVLEQFNEGRRAWSSISLASRNLAFIIWLHTPPTTLTADELAALAPMSKERSDEEKMKAILEKRTMINLIQAFAVASKHYLRHEPGVFYEDLYYLVAPLPKYSFPSTTREDDRASILGLWRQPNEDGYTAIPYHPNDEQLTRRNVNPANHAPRTDLPPKSFSSPRPDPQQRGSSTRSSSATAHSIVEMDSEAEKAPGITLRAQHKLKPSFCPPRQTVWKRHPLLLPFRPFVRYFSTDRGRRARAGGRTGSKRRAEVGSNVPLELSLFLSSWVSTLVQRGTLQTPFVAELFAATGKLQDSITTLERVVTTPLPFAYQAHLRASVWIWLLTLPFQVYEYMGWITVPTTCITAAIYLGFLEIATQIEDPFGYDEADLDLDDYCAMIAAELREIVAHPQHTPASFVFSPLNRPFYPADERTASEVFDQVQPSGGALGDGELTGVNGLRRLMGIHFHKMESLAELERNTQVWSHKAKKGTGKEVEVFLV